MIVIYGCGNNDYRLDLNDPSFMPDIAENFEFRTKFDELKFRCYYNVDVLERVGNLTRHSNKVINIPLEDMPPNTVRYTRYLIHELFLNNPMKWADRYDGVTVDDLDKLDPKLTFRPIKIPDSEGIAEVWRYKLVIGVSTIKNCLVSKSGYVLYEGVRANQWEVGYRKKISGSVYIDIIDEYSRATRPDGVVTEYILRDGTNKLELLNKNEERVNVMRYINNYYDGKYWNGKK